MFTIGRDGRIIKLSLRRLSWNRTGITQSIVVDGLRNTAQDINYSLSRLSLFQLGGIKSYDTKDGIYHLHATKIPVDNKLKTEI